MRDRQGERGRGGGERDREGEREREREKEREKKERVKGREEKGRDKHRQREIEKQRDRERDKEWDKSWSTLKLISTSNYAPLFPFPDGYCLATVPCSALCLFPSVNANYVVCLKRAEYQVLPTQDNYIVPKG